MSMRYILILLLASSFVSINNAVAEEAPDWNATTLTGDWGGARSKLYSKGLSLEFTHKSDVMSNVSGGSQRGSAWLGHTEARIKFDLEKLLDWHTTTGYLHYHSQLGSKFNTNYVGSFSGVDNIEAGTNTAQFAQAWMQKSFADDSLAVLAGLYQIDSEFYVTDTSSVFMQPPYGMANDLSQTGNTPIFPIGALAIRVKYTSPGKNFYLQGAVADGVPGDPNNPQGTHIKLGNGDGTLAIIEFGYTPQQDELPFEAAKPGELIEPKLKVHEEHESFNKTAIGFWRYSAQLNSLVDTADPLLYASRGVYFLAERSLIVEQNHPEQGLAGFVRLGTASKDVYQADWTGSLGLRYHGLLEGRDDDIAGIAVTYNHASDKFRLLNVGATSNQTQAEATYRAQIKPWFALQPTLQFISNPNMKLDDTGSPTLQNVWIIGARAEINL